VASVPASTIQATPARRSTASVAQESLRDAVLLHLFPNDVIARGDDARSVGRMPFDVLVVDVPPLPGELTRAFFG
jgi:hypothetical protein